MSGVEEFDNNIQNEQISLLTRVQETASSVVEWAQDKIEGGREKVLPYIGGGALVLAGMGIIAGEAQAQEEPSASSLKKISSLEHKWSKACKKNEKGFHMELVGPRKIDELGAIAPHTLVAMSCSALRGVKLQVVNETGRHTWKKNMRPRVMFEKEVDIEYPERDPSDITKGTKWATGLQAKKGRKMIFWKLLKIPYDIQNIKDPQESVPTVQ